MARAVHECHFREGVTIRVDASYVVDGVGKEGAMTQGFNYDLWKPSLHRTNMGVDSRVSKVDAHLGAFGVAEGRIPMHDHIANELADLASRLAASHTVVAQPSSAHNAKLEAVAYLIARRLAVIESDYLAEEVLVP